MNKLQEFAIFIVDAWHLHISWPISEIVAQLTHKQSKLLVCRKGGRVINLVYSFFQVPYGEHRYSCRRCSMELHVPVKAVYFDTYDMFACLRCNLWLENPGIFGAPKNLPKATALVD